MPWFRHLLPLLLASAALAADPATIYLELGRGAQEVQRWDGSLEVSNGKLVGLESRHFSADDELTADNSWRASNRKDEIEGFPRVNYNEMSPAELPAPVYSPIGLYATIESGGDAGVRVHTEQGDFTFRMAELGAAPKTFLDGRVAVRLAPRVEKLSTETYEDDEPAIAALPDGGVAVAWVAYRDRADRVLLRTRTAGGWGEAVEVTPEAGDLWRVSLAVDADGGLWVFWSQREGAKWDVWGRRRADGRWSEAQRISGDGSNTFHRAAASEDGTVHVVWQSFRSELGHPASDIWLRTLAGGSWSEPQRVSESPASDWEPAVAGGPGSTAFIAWDGYDAGHYDVFFRSIKADGLGPLEQVTSSPKFQAHVSVAVDPQGRPWLAWNEGGVNWGKDQGYLITPPMAVPLHQERTVSVAMRGGEGWLKPAEQIPPFYPYRLFANLEKPHIAFDGNGTLTMVFRHWTRQNAFGIGSKLMWENFLTRFDGKSWTEPLALAHSAGSIEKLPALVRNGDSIAAAWMTDNRPFEDMVPRNAEIYFADLGASGQPPSYGELQAFVEPYAEAVPIHPNEAENVRAIRDYEILAGDKSFKILRGDMHRHTDVSQDFKYDGSLIEVYRYALDAAAFDYIVPTDHQLGYDQEFTWWQDEKLTDLFHVPEAFVPLFGYERSLRFPNGHRNIIFAKRGTRPLPIPEAEQRGEIRAGPLYQYLHENDGISMPHSSGTDQGTDWADNDPEVEPLMEIFQGYRASYEYQDAPLAASEQKLREQRSGFNPLGYYWDALAKGYKIGVQASSDHWSTHISYAMILSEDFTRESMFEALKKRHAYGATDNIILDFQAETEEGETYIMGDIAKSSKAPQLFIKAIGTDRIKQFVIVKNQKIIYEKQPNADSFTLRFIDRDFEPGQNYYYVRVLQNDGMVAWSSPIWVE